MALLPRIRTREQYLSSPRDEATYSPAVREICRRHSLPSGRVSKYPGGSTIVFAIGDAHVVKLFEPIFTEAAATEEAVLAHLHGKLEIPTPALVAAGELEGWRYVIMEQLPGLSLAEAWSHIPDEGKTALCWRLGRAVARQHALELPTLPGPEWSVFLPRQVERCVEQQRQHGLAERWLVQIPDFVASVDLSAPERSLLHTEIMREHLLVQKQADGWEFSGLFDFEPAMVGAPEYELASVGIFVAGGAPGLWSAFLRGYGYTEASRTLQLQRRILAFALLHRYSNLRWYLERIPPKSATTLDELAAEWFAYR